jgi:hypothetical protein
MTALADLTDYELLIGPVATADEQKVDYMLLVASSVVASKATGLLPWWWWDPANPPLDDDGNPVPDPGPVPEPAVLVTCQTASNLITGGPGGGAIQMERTGLAETTYAPAENAEGLLPVAWKTILKPWRPPDMATVRLVVPHPSEYLRGGYGADWWWPIDDNLILPDPEPWRSH